MSTRCYEEADHERNELDDNETVVSEPSPTTKLARRRKIEDLFEEKRLKEEMEDFN